MTATSPVGQEAKRRRTAVRGRAATAARQGSVPPAAESPPWRRSEGQRYRRIPQRGVGAEAIIAAAAVVVLAEKGVTLRQRQWGRRPHSARHLHPQGRPPNESRGKGRINRRHPLPSARATTENEEPASMAAVRSGHRRWLFTQP